MGTGEIMVQGKGCDWGRGGGGGVTGSSMGTQKKIVILYNYRYVKELAYSMRSMCVSSYMYGCTQKV